MCLHTLYLFEDLLICQIPKHINVLQGTSGCHILLALKKKKSKEQLTCTTFLSAYQLPSRSVAFLSFSVQAHACCNHVLVILTEKKKGNLSKLAYKQIFFTQRSLWEPMEANFKFENISSATALYTNLCEIRLPDKYTLMITTRAVFATCISSQPQSTHTGFLKKLF